MGKDLQEYVAESSQLGQNGVSALETELEIFTSRDVAHQSRKHLEHLKTTLTRNKGDLSCLMKKFEALDSCFSEDADNSVIHQTVVQLFKCSQVKDECVSELALKCLGEMGPVNLSAFLLNPSNHVKQVATTR